jgi:chromosomal replication initiator protein
MGISNGVLWLRTGTEMQQRYLQSECLSPFRDAAQSATQRLLAVEFLGPGEAPPRNSSNGRSKNTQTQPAFRHAPVNDDELVLNPDCMFDSFINGPSNRLAHAAARAVGENPGSTYNPLFIHGGVGLGKTHLLQAICHRFLEEDPAARILYLSCEGFITRFMDAVQLGLVNDFRRQFSDISMLVIDDVNFLCKRDSTQEEFFHTFNTLYQTNRQIVLSSDASPDEIPDLEKRLVSRFNWGLVAQIESPDYETRAQIVQKKAQDWAIDLPVEAAGLIAARYDSNIRELEGALRKVQMYTHVEKVPITLSSVNDALGVASKPTRPRTNIQTIIDEVAEYYELPVAQLLSRRRQRSIALPRHVGMYLARELTMHSLQEIGGYFGGRDHTTVLHAVRTIAAQRVTNTDLDAEIIELTLILNSKPD